MSYVPYTPDVQPHAHVHEERGGRRVLYWILGTFGYLVAILVWVLWMKQPPKIQPSLASFPLTDGNELRLVNTYVGANAEIRGWDTFKDRIRLPTDYGVYSSSIESGDGVWLFFTRFTPAKERFAKPVIAGAAVIEEGTASRFPGKVINNTLASVYDVVLLPVVPRRSPILTVELTFFASAEKIVAQIPNPAYQPNAPVRNGVNLPHQKVVDGITVELRKVRISKENVLNSDGRRQEYFRATPDLRISFPGMPESSFQLNAEWFDATGNRTRSSVLPFSEKVWGLEVKFRETNASPFPPERIAALGKFKAPGPGQVISMPVSPAMDTLGVSEVFVMGQGQYQRQGQQLLYLDPTGARPVVANSKLSRYYSFSVNAWEIFVVARPPNKQNSEGIMMFLRARHAGETIQPGSQGTSSSGEITYKWGSFRGKSVAVIPAGAEVELELLFPVDREVKFLINAPPLPAK